MTPFACRFCFYAAAWLAASAAAWAQSDPAAVIPCAPWPLTDALGRSAPAPEEAGPPQPGRFVGIFYFVWQEHADVKRPDVNSPYDVAKILAQDPDALKKPASPLWGPIGTYHYWAEPLFGYYRPTDPWVLRRHAHLLADAGIDVLILDATNALTYRHAYERLCGVFEEVRSEGGRTPRIAFMLNSDAGKTAAKLFADLYQPGLHRDLWFLWQGKPLLLCESAQASPEVRGFFTLRRAHWPFEMVNTPFAWHWEAAYPQPYGYTDDPGKPEQVNVSVAQNLRAADGKVTNMSHLDARGRSFHDGRPDVSPGAVDRGLNFQEQWKRAFDLAPPFVMVTGWNEWIAGRWGNAGGPIIFVDQYDQEYSRDIEPVRGGHGDNYYCQLVANIRKYKGVGPLPKASAPRTLAVEGGFEAWADVAPEYRDHAGETIPRDHDGVAGSHYADRSARNDLDVLKVSRDGKSLYFYARTREPLSPREGGSWMWLLIDADRSPATGWEGFEWIVNRTLETDGSTWLEKSAGPGWSWTKAERIPCRGAGKELQLAIPRKALGLPEDAAKVSIDFKWADGIQRPGDILDFYSSGDVAPEGRMRYRYSAE